MWQEVYQEENSKQSSAPLGEDFHGWNSSYDGQPIPLGEMEEWRDVTVARILELHPKKVLEIGVGTGLLLSRLAPQCTEYWGIDFSQRVIDRLRDQVSAIPNLSRRTHLRCQQANVADGLPAGSFDTVVINSVAQYFPTPEYLVDVVRQAMNLLGPDGTVFLGDIRSLPLHFSFCTAVELMNATEPMVPESIRSAVERRLLLEKELVLDPRFFVALQSVVGGISGLDIRVKQGLASNELTRYRYDVVLRKGVGQQNSAAELPKFFWGDGIKDVESLVAVAASHPNGVRFCNVPNARLWDDLLLIADYDGLDLSRYIENTGPYLVPVETFSSLGRKTGHRVVATWSQRSQYGELDVVFLPQKFSALTDVYLPQHVAGEYTNFGNNPSKFEEVSQLATELRSFLLSRLPEHMVPAAFVVLDALPLTPNGKVDRRALPAPADEAYARGVSEAPVGEVESLLAGLWSELLGVERIGRRDSFFTLGGHSLLAVRLVSRVRREFGVELTLAKLFVQPVLVDMAAVVADLIGGSGRELLPAIRLVDRGGVLPLSFAQQRLWFLGQLDGVNASYHIPLVLRLRGPLDRAALRRSLDRLWARHEGLRSVFVAEGGEPHVELLGADAGFGLVEDDLRGDDEAPARLAELCRETADAPFDLARGPLVRGRLIRLGDEEHVLAVTQHHIVSDGWSVEVFLRELRMLYAAFVRGEEDPLPALHVQYPDYAVWQREWLSGERQASQARYWGSELANAPALLTLPTDRARPPQQSFAGAHVGVRLDRELTRELKALSVRHGTTLFMTVLAAWASVLSRLSGQDDVVVGTPVANRSRTETEGLIGFFVNTLALRVDLSGSPDVETLLSQVRSKVVSGQDNQDLPFEQVVEIVQPARRLDHTPLFQVMFSWENEDVVASTTLDGLSVSPVDTEYEVAKFDLDLALGEAGDEIVGALGYATALFDASTIERHAGYLEAVLRGFVADAASPVGRLDLVGPRERRLLLEEWNDTAVPFADEACVHEMFEAQVACSPDAVALVHEGSEISYRELNARANRLAHRLIRLGVRPDTRVGICVERSPLMIVALLGVLKAGGAYVPLDPAYPADRLAFMLSDSNPLAVLADANTAGLVGAMLEEEGAACPVLDLSVAERDGGSEANPVRSALGLTST
ncbi:methyltransferase, partial [Micromonospora sp. KC606]